jgi:hypothetical protein
MGKATPLMANMVEGGRTPVLAGERIAGARLCLRPLARRLDEQHVGAGFAIERGARDGALEAFDGDRRRREARRRGRGSAASVRAMINVSSAWRESAAALILPTMSGAAMSVLPSRWPQRLGKSWSSSWMALAPARSSSRTVRSTLSALP